MIAFLSRFIGFTLLFIGALVAVSFGYPGGGCFQNPTSPPTCAAGSTFVTGAATAILAGHVLFALGAFFLGAGAGLKLHFSLQAPASGDREAMRWVMADRWFNGLIIVVSIWILWSLLVGVPFFASGI